MALTQMQIIQALGEAMSRFEWELTWGVPPTELRHLCGCIGELYAALVCNTGDLWGDTFAHPFDDARPSPDQKFDLTHHSNAGRDTQRRLCRDMRRGLRRPSS
jgi:hypothetical protein